MRNEENGSLLYRLYSLLLCWKAFINLPVGIWGKLGWGLWPHMLRNSVFCAFCSELLPQFIILFEYEISLITGSFSSSWCGEEYIVCLLISYLLVQTHMHEHYKVFSEKARGTFLYVLVFMRRWMGDAGWVRSHTCDFKRIKLTNLFMRSSVKFVFRLASVLSLKLSHQ